MSTPQAPTAINLEQLLREMQRRQGTTTRRGHSMFGYYDEQRTPGTGCTCAECTNERTKLIQELQADLKVIEAEQIKNGCPQRAAHDLHKAEQPSGVSTFPNLDSVWTSVNEAYSKMLFPPLMYGLAPGWVNPAGYEIKITDKPKEPETPKEWTYDDVPKPPKRKKRKASEKQNEI